MGDRLNENRREAIWNTLAEAFICDEVNYELLHDVEISQLEKIFFNEVALHCAPQMFSVTPPIDGFLTSVLISDIWKKLEQEKKSTLTRYGHKILVVIYRFFFRNEWNSVVDGLEKYKQSING